MFLVGAYVVNGFSFNHIRPEYYRASVRNDLQNVYVACRAYWADTNSANICNVDNVAFQTAYGYLPSPNVAIWGKGGNLYDFNLKEKSRKADGVYSLTIKTIKAESKVDQVKMDIRRLENEELDSALIEMNKQLGLNKRP